MGFEELEQQMGFSGGEEPDYFLRLRPEDKPEVVQYVDAEPAEANQQELQKGYHSDGKVIHFSFKSVLTGNDRSHRTSGRNGRAPGLLIGLKNATDRTQKDPTGHYVVREVEPGDFISIDRTGSEGDTRYNVQILTPEEVEMFRKQNAPSDTDSNSTEESAAAPQPSESQTSEPQTSTFKGQELDTAPKNEEEINIDDIPF